MFLSEVFIIKKIFEHQNSYEQFFDNFYKWFFRFLYYLFTRIYIFSNI